MTALLPARPDDEQEQSQLSLLSEHASAPAPWIMFGVGGRSEGFV